MTPNEDFHKSMEDLTERLTPHFMPAPAHVIVPVETLAMVLGLACVTEGRTPSDNAAMLAVAHVLESTGLPKMNNWVARVWDTHDEWEVDE